MIIQQLDAPLCMSTSFNEISGSLVPGFSLITLAGVVFDNLRNDEINFRLIVSSIAELRLEPMLVRIVMMMMTNAQWQIYN